LSLGAKKHKKNKKKTETMIPLFLYNEFGENNLKQGINK